MKLIRWIITLAYAGFIFYLSSQTWSGVPHFPYADKVYHVILYFGLGGLLLWSLRITRLRDHNAIGFVALFIAVLYGISDELHQAFVPGRECDPLDFIADLTGAVIGILLAAKIATLIRKEKVQP